MPQPGDHGAPGCEFCKEASEAKPSEWWRRRELNANPARFVNRLMARDFWGERVRILAVAAACRLHRRRSGPRSVFADSSM